jgi:hypothetical protein
MASSGILRRVALVRSDISEELNASFIRVTRIGELETTLAVPSNRRTLRNIPEDTILYLGHVLIVSQRIPTCALVCRWSQGGITGEPSIFRTWG